MAVPAVVPLSCVVHLECMAEVGEGSSSVSGCTAGSTMKVKIMIITAGRCVARTTERNKRGKTAPWASNPNCCGWGACILGRGGWASVVFAAATPECELARHGWSAGGLGVSAASTAMIRHECPIAGMPGWQAKGSVKVWMGAT